MAWVAIYIFTNGCTGEPGAANLFGSSIILMASSLSAKPSVPALSPFFGQPSLQTAFHFLLFS